VSQVYRTPQHAQSIASPRTLASAEVAFASGDLQSNFIPSSLLSGNVEVVQHLGLYLPPVSEYLFSSSHCQRLWGDR
jgi:hypothetical protein